MKVLTFDFGASSGRGIVFELKDGQLSSTEIHRFDNDPVMIGKSFHWDVLRLFHEIKTGISKCVNGGYDISAIGIDTWGVDYGLLDANGNLLSNPYHYRDTRTEDVKFNEAEKTIIFKKTGIQFTFFNTLLQMIAEKNNPAFEKAETALFMPDLFNYFLTGEKRSEYTIASTSQMLNASERTFDKGLLAMFDLPDIFPKMIQPGEIVGYLSDDICEELGAKKVPVIAVASHDTASAVVCAPMEKPEKSLYISCGTWLLMGAETNSPIINEKSYKYNYTNEGGAFGKYRFLRNIMGTWIQQECRRELKRRGTNVSYADMESMALPAEPFKCLINPNNEVFARPGNMPKRIEDYAVETHQNVPSSVGELNRTIMESLALACAQTVIEISEILEQKIDTINMVGGGIQSNMLCQFIANATNMRVVAGPVEATGTGNALMQFVGLGEINDIEEARKIVMNSYGPKIYMPEDTEKWNEAYERFEKLI